MIRIFVGTAPNAADLESQAVLEYTLRKHASEEIEIVWMRMAHDGFWSGFRTDLWATAFSGFRWAIPAYCGYEGRAIYMDSDIIARGDIAELWHQDFNGKTVLAKHGGRLCVSLWDCAAAKAVVPPIDQLRADPEAHRKMGIAIRPHVGPFIGNWNQMDGPDDGLPLDLSDPAIKAIHYTVISSQPQIPHALKRLTTIGQKHWFDGTVVPHPRRDLQALFDRLLEEASAAGYPPERYMPEEMFGDFRKRSLAHYRGHAA